MKFVEIFKNYIKKLIKNFSVPQTPIGLTSLGIRRKCLDKINKFNYSVNRFCMDLSTPVHEPYYLKFKQ